jgi:hypothetical protein
MSLLSALPQNVVLQTGNGQNLITWNLVTGATSYTVQRSVDGATWSTVGSPAVNAYLDVAVTIGTNYFYQIASVSGAGTSGYSPSFPASITPCAPGQINLGYMRYQAKLRADMLNSPFVTNDEWNVMLNSSAFELYDLLVAKFGEDYFLAPPLIVVSNSSLFYPLPDGTNYPLSAQPGGGSGNALACYKVYGLDFNTFGAQLNNTQGWLPMSRFNWVDRNKYNVLLGAASNNVAGQYLSCQYREMGSNLYIIPTNTGQYFRLWYVPLAQQLLQDTDMLPFSYSAWYEYAVVDAAAKALAKQQLFDQANELLQRKAALEIRIETTAANRDVGQPNTISNTRSRLGDPNFSSPGSGGGGGFGGGWGSGWGY